MSGGRRRTGRATRPCDVRHETYDIRATEKEDPDCRTDIAHPLPLRLPPPRQCHCQCQRPTPPACRPSPAAVFIVYFFARACVRPRARRVLSAIPSVPYRLPPPPRRVRPISHSTPHRSVLRANDTDGLATCCLKRYILLVNSSRLSRVQKIVRVAERRMFRRFRVLRAIS